MKRHNCIFLLGPTAVGKTAIGIRCYVRYVDDAVLLAHDRGTLESWRDEIAQWLWSNRGLEISKDKTTIKPLNSGIDFVGRVILPYRTYPRRMTVGKAREAVALLRKSPLNKKFVDMVNAYIGLMQHSNSYRIRRALCRHAVLRGVISCDRDCTKVWHII